jgi:hypothetical protein
MTDEELQKTLSKEGCNGVDQVIGKYVEGPVYITPNYFNFPDIEIFDDYCNVVIQVSFFVSSPLIPKVLFVINAVPEIKIKWFSGREMNIYNVKLKNHCYIPTDEDEDKHKMTILLSGRTKI